MLVLTVNGAYWQCTCGGRPPTSIFQLHLATSCHSVLTPDVSDSVSKAGLPLHLVLPRSLHRFRDDDAGALNGLAPNFNFYRYKIHLGVHSRRWI